MQNPLGARWRLGWWETLGKALPREEGARWEAAFQADGESGSKKKKENRGLSTYSEVGEQRCKLGKSRGNMQGSGQNTMVETPARAGMRGCWRGFKQDHLVGKHKAAETHHLGSDPGPSLTPTSSAGAVTACSLGSLSCKMGITSLPVSQGHCEDYVS